jgi:carbonic anhydrase
MPIIVLVWALVLAACAAGAHWGYTGEQGPEYWYTLNPSYAIARDGKAQSPVNIGSGDTVTADIVSKPVFQYSAAGYELENNGHTIELVPSAYDNYITLDGNTYRLQQFHFHSPGEHQINGESFAMELHLVHKDAGGNLAVAGFLITRGNENRVFKEVFAGLSGGKREYQINLFDLLPAGEGIYRYDGSLTTPPCTEGVKWIVFSHPIEMSKKQIDAFRAIYDGNNRPIQNLNGRKIYFTD